MKKIEISLTDMPKGYSNFRTYLEKQYGTKYKYQIRGSMSTFDWFQALDLMKEMYEALEYMSKDDVVEGHICDPNFEYVRPILEKFKNWK